MYSVASTTQTILIIKETSYLLPDEMESNPTHEFPIQKGVTAVSSSMKRSIRIKCKCRS